MESFGTNLRTLRTGLGWSQLDLAMAAGVSSRHLSFLETGRSLPSRAMVLALAESLDLGLRQRNQLLLAAGFAPAYPERSLSDDELAMVRRGLERLIESQNPFPAFVLDRGWNILMANRAHHRMLAALLPASAAGAGPLNAARLVLDPSLLKPAVRNWNVVAHVLGHRLARQLRALDPGDPVRAGIEAALELPGVRAAINASPEPAESMIVIPVELDLLGHALSFFSTIATLGTPQDVTLQEIRIESLFPADAETDRIVRAFAAS